MSSTDRLLFTITAGRDDYSFDAQHLEFEDLKLILHAVKDIQIRREGKSHITFDESGEPMYLTEPR